MTDLRCSIMKPPNKRSNRITKLPATIEASTVRKTEATKRNMDNDVKCTVKSRINWQMNLKI